MTMESKPGLSIGERLGLAFAIVKTLSVATLSLFTALFRGTSGHKVYFNHVAHNALKTMNSTATARQVQAINVSTDEAYKSFAKAQGFKPIVVELPLSGGKILWMGNPDAPKVLVCLHGGGFVYPAAAQFGWCWDLLSSRKLGPDVAVAFLSMGLAPESAYPKQLSQMVEMVRYLTNDAGKLPENIVVQGDSSGAQLGLAFISHLMHPHPNPLVPELKLAGQLSGLALISPWVTPSTESASFERNAGRDVVNRQVLSHWAQYALGGAEPDEYNAPVTAKSSWWSGIQKVVKEIIVTAGTSEVLFDDIESFVHTLQPSTKNMQVAFAEETHDQPLMDPIIGIKEDCETSKVVKAWIISRFHG